ncbi:glycosyltransferase [Dongia rigui]|uniref:Glycosyltransferase n=1 Tax=Dongia rigui TaxID=940149 RepID=A0ABU5DZ32_9PROT|nr:glycosyltransferase [Dongia rigui]MDY0872573.1 glycosyltransferase [Dongia rigui]
MTGSSPQRRRVAFIINSLAGGGAERVMCTLLRASEEERRDVDITLILLDQEPAAYTVPDWVRIEQLDCRHSFARSLGQLFTALRRLRPDVVLSFLTRANIAAALACRALGIAAVISERVNTSSHLGTGGGAMVARLLVRLCYPLARKIIAVSPGVADDLADAFGIARAKLMVIANPVDLDGIRRQGDEAPAVVPGVPYIMAMGRLVPNKNFAMLIEAYAQAEMSEQLFIFGEGGERENLQGLIGKLGLEGRVHLPGFCANPYAILKHAALFVLPSNAEGFPNSLLEAMSLRVPVVSTNCLSGPAEVLADVARERVTEPVTFAPHGILVTPDNVADMAQGLRAMKDPERRASYAEKAERRAADFSVARAKNAYWDALRAEMTPPAAASGAPLRAQ